MLHERLHLLCAVVPRLTPAVLCMHCRRMLAPVWSSAFADAQWAETQPKGYWDRLAALWPCCTMILSVPARHARQHVGTMSRHRNEPAALGSLTNHTVHHHSAKLYSYPGSSLNAGQVLCTLHSQSLPCLPCHALFSHTLLCSAPNMCNRPICARCSLCKHSLQSSTSGQQGCCRSITSRHLTRHPRECASPHRCYVTKG